MRYDCEANNILLVIAPDGKYIQFYDAEIDNLSDDDEEVYYEINWLKKYNLALPSCAEIYAAESTNPLAIDHSENPFISSEELTWCNEVCDDGNDLTLELVWDLKLGLKWSIGKPVDKNHLGWKWLKERYENEYLEKINYNPFHDEFDDNFVSGKSETKELTLEALKANAKSMADSLWI